MTSAFPIIRQRGLQQDALTVAHDVAMLPMPVLRQVAPLIAQAEQETARALRHWLANVPGGGTRYTAYQHARVLVQLRQAFDTVQRISPALAAAMGQGASRAGILSAQHLTGIVNRNSARFGTSLEAPLRIDLAARSGLGELRIQQFARSAARYSQSVQDEIRQQLAIGVLRHETTGQLIERLAARSTVSRAAGVDEAAHGLFRTADWRIEHLVRTEMAAVYDDQALEAFRQARAQMPDLRRVWDATPDMRLCSACKEMHGAVSGPDGAFSKLLPGPPLHPN